MNSDMLLKRNIIRQCSGVVLLYIWSGVVTACTPTEVLSPVTLLDQADAVFLAIVTGSDKPDKKEKEKLESYSGPAKYPWHQPLTDVHFRVLDTYKGNLEQENFSWTGTVSTYYGPNDRQVPYQRVRPGGQRGSCYAYDYLIGHYYLMILKGNSPYWAPLSPTNEEVIDRDDPWIWWVRGVLAAQENIQEREG